MSDKELTPAEMLPGAQVRLDPAKRRVVRSTPIFTPEKEVQLYLGMQGSIMGFAGCCSAATMCGMYTQRVGDSISVFKNTPIVKKFKKINSFNAYHQYYGNRGVYGLPEEYAYLHFLESVYTKASKGEGGQKGESGGRANYPMFSGDHWATKTWFIADRVTGRGYPENNLGCASFMKYMSHADRANDYGVMVLSPLAAGAHGGQCRGGVWAPNLPYLEERLTSAVLDLNRHAAWLEEVHYKDVTPAVLDVIAAKW